MKSRIKKLETGKRLPRFDFTSDGSDDGSQTATIKELMDELVYEDTTSTSGKPLDTSGKQMSIRQLGPVLRLLRSISGKALRSITEQHPLLDIKTIKTLYRYSYDKNMHLIGLIEPPGSDSQAIMNILTSPPTEQNAIVFETKRRIISDLEREISADEKEQIDAILNPQYAPRAYWAETNAAIDKILLTHLHLDEDSSLLIEADPHLAAKTNEFMSDITPAERETRLHVATYVHLRSLEFLHALNFEITTNGMIPNDRTVDNMQLNFSRICKSILPVHGVTIQGHTPFMSLADVPAFCSDNATEIARLVSIATGFTYNKRDILGGKDANRAKYALAVYLASIKLPSGENPKPIGVVHVVAAFCSVLHQRKMKSKPKTSRRYGSKLVSPQKQLDAFIEGKDKQLAPTAWFIYSERTLWYTHAMLCRTHLARSHKPLQTEQAKLNSAIYTSLNHVLIRKLTSSYRVHMVKAAQGFVTLHGKDATKYEPIHGLRQD
ncbi:MAG: hypothetical protein ACN6RK_01830 [Stenotrophomonas sp.]